MLLILRAFSAGSVALTGTEAVSNGVPAFKPPESRNARIVLILMGGLLRLDLPRHQLPGRAAGRSFPTRPRRRRSSASSPASWSAPAVRSITSSRSRRRCSWCWPRTPPSPTSPGWPASSARTVSCRASSSSAATGSRSRRHHGPRGPGRRPDRRLRGQRHEPDPALHGRRLRRLHPEPERHGAPLVELRERAAGWRWRAALNGVGAVATGVVAIEVASPSSRSGRGWCSC